MVVSKKRRMEIMVVSFVLCFVFGLSTITSIGENSIHLTNSPTKDNVIFPQPRVNRAQVMMQVDFFGIIITIFAFIGFIVLITVYMIKFRKKRKKIEEPISSPQYTETRSIDSGSTIQALRGGEFIGNRLRFKVKVLNTSPYVITDVTVTLISYPRDSLRFEGETVKSIAKIDREGFRSPTFDFLPTQDCVKGDIIASVSYVDSRGQAHSVTTEPYQIRAVCDLLRPEVITSEEFVLKLGTLGHGKMTSKVDDWTPEEMHDKVLHILRSSNFFEVSSELSQFDDHIESKIKGWAKGIYTGNNIGVEIVVSGKSGINGATCNISMAGEDQAMIMPAIDEFCQKINAWLCPKCGGALPFESVEELKAGKSVACPFCGVTMDR